MDEMQEDYPRPLHNRPHRGMDQAVFGVDMSVVLFCCECDKWSHKTNRVFGTCMVTQESTDELHCCHVHNASQTAVD